MNRLAYYYHFRGNDDEKGWYWMERAAESGDSEARELVLNYYKAKDGEEAKLQGERLRKKWGM
jgi:hypothetical protein